MAIPLKQTNLFHGSKYLDSQFEIQKRIETINFKSPDDILFYTKLEPLNIDEKKLNGVFYTDNEKILNELTKNINFEKSIFKIVDPSCGEGDILIYLIKKYINSFKKLHNTNTLIRNIFSNFYGFDIDSNACLLTKYKIYTALKKFFNENILNEFNFNNLNIFHSDFTLKSNIQKFKNYFDFVVGNPPFITYYGKQAKPLIREKKQYYIDNYNFIVNKKNDNRLNSSMFFIENGMSILKKNGVLNFILDISFFEPPYQQIRNFINRYKILKITDNIKGFKNVYSGQLVISVSKRSKQENSIVKWKDFETKKILKIQNRGFNFIKPLFGKDDLIINKIKKDSKNLSNFFDKKEIRTNAVLTGRTNDFIYDCIPNNSINNFYPFIEGSKGLPDKFYINIPSNRYLEYNYKKQLKISDEFKIELEKRGVKNKKRIGLGDEVAYKNPKIFIRQSAKKLICAYTEKSLSANNSIYVIFKKLNLSQNQFLLKYISCLLNSEILTFYAIKTNIIRMNKGKIPQIRLSDLYRLPIKLSDKKAMQNIIDCIYNRNNIKDLNKMNNLITTIYNINQKELNYILDFNNNI